MLLLNGCGWTQRLRETMFGRAVMLHARMSLLPPGHFACSLMEEATKCSGENWAGVVHEIHAGKHGLHAFPTIQEFLGEADMLQARVDRNLRRRSLKRYARTVVEPALAQYDETAFSKAITDSPWPYGTLQGQLQALPQDLGLCDWPADGWRHYRTWAAVKATGRLPLQDGVHDLPFTLDVCPWCGACNVGVQHFLAECSGTWTLRREWQSVEGACCDKVG